VPGAPIGVVFLHGWMGNLSVQCWQIAQVVSIAGAVTVCPSTSWLGSWWTLDGEATIRATFRYLRGRGIRRIYLGGFSKGGSGIGELISALASEPGLQGLFFIAGVNNGTAVREAGLPVLVIQGIQDERMPVEAARRFVGEVGTRATHVELDADHFVIMKQPHLVQKAISTWVEGHESGN
jgi:pimeloyl-ACP methyl ester carboxylesterase